MAVQHEKPVSRQEYAEEAEEEHKLGEDDDRAPRT
jgi:hypothetical protein